ncbi:MAG: hypothetical protein GY950_01070 [bacterium]|nr:hypothetical protein [bacterium]
MEFSSTFTLIVSVVISTGALVYVFYVLTKMFYKEKILKASLSKIMHKRENLSEDSESKLVKDVDQKKVDFLKLPNISFHYANKEEIKSFYNDYFKEPTFEQIVTEIADEIEGGVKGNIPKMLEAKMGGKNIQKWISTLKFPDISVSEMFRRYQRETIKNNQVTLGLELVDIDLSDLNAFNELVEKLEVNFDYEFESSKLENNRSALRKKAAESTLKRLENASGSILIEGKFEIADFPNEFYKCIYFHPVNEYYAEEEKKVVLSFMVRKDSLEANIAGNYAQSLGKLIPMKVYGKVWQPIDLQQNIWELQITPLAVYQ